MGACTGSGVGAEAGGGTGPRPRRKLNAKQRAELLRRQVDTVGRPGQPGGGIRNVISVGMLYVWQAIRFENTERLTPVFDRDRPIRSTGDMVTWYTGRPCDRTARSHINFCVHDSTWEASEAYALDHSPLVDAWVKNDHLGFEVFYVHAGVVHKYRPDFLIRLGAGDMLVLEVKGRERDRDHTKRRFLDEWVAALNAHGGFGRWRWAVSRKPSDVHDVLAAANDRAVDGSGC